MSLPKFFKFSGEINDYSDEGSEKKAVFHKEGVVFLKKLANELGYSGSEFSVRSNKGGIAVSGEVTMHSDTMYVQLFQARKGVDILYRKCHGQKDFTGESNHYITSSDIESRGMDFQDIADRIKVLDLQPFSTPHPSIGLMKQSPR